MLTGELRNKVDKIWETLWTAGISNPLTVIEQLTYLLFIKGLDDQQLKAEKKAERTGKAAENPTFGNDQQHLRWRNLKQLGPEELFETIRDEVFPFMKELGGQNGSTFRKHMEGATIDYMDSLSSEGEVMDEAFDLILANPPFKGSLDYDSVASDLLQTVKTKKTELLFFPLFLRALKVGGRAAVVVPDGVLFGSSKAHKEVRRILVEEQQLNAIISMPSGVFKPYAGVSTAVVIFTKTNSGGTDTVWFYDMKADGYSLDDKRDELPDDNDIPDLVARYHALEKEADRTRTEQSFLVPKAEIVEQNYDLSINRYKEIEYEAVEYDSPKEIINGKEGEPGLRQLAEERLRILDELEGMV